MIFLDKPFEVGDRIQYDKYEGIVEDVTFRSTRIRNVEDTLINVPNSLITNAVVTNWSRLVKRRFSTNIMLNIHTEIEKIEIFKNRIKELLKDNNDIVKDSIVINISTVAANGINLEITMYVNSTKYYEYLKISEDINKHIINILNEESLVA